MPIDVALQPDPANEHTIKVVLLKNGTTKTVWNETMVATQSSYGNIVANIKRGNF